MALTQVTKYQALSKSQFHAQLREWIKLTIDDEVADPTIGPAELIGQHLGRTPWLFVRDGDGGMFCLHADARRSTVVRYLELVDEHGDDLLWTVVPSQRGSMTAVAFGPEATRLKPAFYLYAVAGPRSS